jgi:hypothetical protein
MDIQDDEFQQALQIIRKLEQTRDSGSAILRDA